MMVRQWDEKGYVNYYQLIKDNINNTKFENALKKIGFKEIKLKKELKLLNEEYLLVKNNNYAAHIVCSQEYVHIVIISKNEEIERINSIMKKNFPQI